MTADAGVAVLMMVGDRVSATVARKSAMGRGRRAPGALHTIALTYGSIGAVIIRLSRRAPSGNVG